MAQLLKLKTIDTAIEAPWNPEQILAEAEAEKAQFLEQYPQYRPFQSKIDRMMDKAGNNEARMAVLAFMMEGKLIELYSQLRTLNGILVNVAG